MARASAEQPDASDYRFVWPPPEAEWPSFFYYWRGVILRVCASQGLDPDTAEDVVQNVMKSLISGAKESALDFRNISALGGYVTTAVTRQSDRLRTKARRDQSLVGEDAVPDHRARDRFVEELGDVIPDDVPAAERFDWLLKQVRDRNRELFQMMYGQGMRLKEISELLGIPYTTLYGWHQAELHALRRLDRDAT